MPSAPFASRAAPRAPRRRPPRRTTLGRLLTCDDHLPPPAPSCPLPRSATEHLDGDGAEPAVVPGSEKSTLARRFVDDHHLALCLDIDLVRGFWAAGATSPSPPDSLLAVSPLRLWPGRRGPTFVSVIAPRYRSQVASSLAPRRLGACGRPTAWLSRGEQRSGSGGLRGRRRRRVAPRPGGRRWSSAGAR